MPLMAIQPLQVTSNPSDNRLILEYVYDGAHAYTAISLEYYAKLCIVGTLHHLIILRRLRLAHQSELGSKVQNRHDTKNASTLRYKTRLSLTISFAALVN